MHNIDGTRFVAARTPGWHHLGHVVTGEEANRISVEEAVKLGGLDFRIEKAPIGYTTPTGEFIPTSDQVMVIREPRDETERWEPFGIVSSGYEFLQNIELAQELDAVRKKTGWGFETVGSLGKGETVFMTLDMGDREVRGDKYRTYLLAADGRAAGRALAIRVVNERVVCANTLAMAESGALRTIKIAHDAQVAKNYASWLDVIPAIEKASDMSYAQLDEMAGRKIGEVEAAEVFEAAFPVPVKNDRARQYEEVLAMANITELQREAILSQLSSGNRAFEDAFRRTLAKREAAATLYTRFNAGEEVGLKVHAMKLGRGVLKEISETPYAALQAVAELVDHGGSRDKKAAAAGALFGEGAEAKRAAWETALLVARR